MSLAPSLSGLVMLSACCVALAHPLQASAQATRGRPVRPPVAQPVAGAMPVTAPSSVSPQKESLGAFSGDEENEGGETDPKPRPTPRFLNSRAAPGLSSTTRPLSNHPDALAIAREIAQALGKADIDVALLGGQKYMVSECFGLKASAGEFAIRLANPEVRMEGLSVVTTFVIPHVAMNGFRVRFRPNPNNVSNPCTFSKRYGLSGSASDVRLEVRYSPLIDVQACTISAGQVRTHWSIGGLNLKPLQNDLDKVAKNMIVEAANFTDDMMSSRMRVALDQAVVNRPGVCAV